MGLHISQEVNPFPGHRTAGVYFFYKVLLNPHNVPLPQAVSPAQELPPAGSHRRATRPGSSCLTCPFEHARASAAEHRGVGSSE